MPPEPLVAHLLTRSAYYRGSLRYADAPAAVRPRLLDFLNSKARGRGPAGERAANLRLDGAEITVYVGSTRTVSQASSVSLAAHSIVIAFDESRTRLSTMPPPSTLAYEQRMAQEKQPVVVLTLARHRIAGTVRGGIKRMAIRAPDEPFLALTDVTIEDLSIENRQPATLPFVALNMDFIESFWTP